jgi:DNA-binding response OmpR family regulator
MTDKIERRAGEPTKKRVGAVLIVEDDSNVRQALARTLQMSGFTVIETENATGGIEALRADSGVAMVLLDLNMSPIDGRAFRKIQLADPQLAAIPTVVLTGAPLVDVDDATLQADDYLLKPVGREHLVSVVSAYCRANS